MTCAAGFNGGAGATRITATEGSAPASPSSGQQTLYIDTSDHNLKSLDSGSAVRQYATIGGSETLASKTLVNPSLGASALTSAFANESVTGTVAHGLAKLTGNPATAIVASVTDTGGIVGVVTAGAGTAGTAQIAFAGQANCAFDGGTAAGDYVTVSATVAGDCHDAGATYPAAGQIVGRALSANSGTGIYPMTLFGPGLQGAAAPTGGGGSSFDPLDYTTAWVRDEMLTNNQWYIAANDGGTMVFGEPTPGFGDPAHPGIFQLETGTTSGDYSTMSLAWPNSAQIMAYPQGLVWEMRWVAKVGGLTDATYEFGFQDYGGHNALKIMFNPTLGPDWLGVSRNSDTETRVDLGVAASTSSWAKIRIRSDMTKIYFSVNGGAEQTICASGCNVTAAIGLGVSQVWPYAGVTTQTAGFAYMGVDFFAMQFSGLSR
jgi:hypothetical protein